MSKIKVRKMEEVREDFLERVWQIIDLFEKDKPSVSDEKDEYTTRDRMERVAFSILSMLDGGSGTDLPSFLVIPNVSKEDNKWYKEHHECTYSRIKEKHVKCDIAGGLHELFHKVGKEREDRKNKI
jgi:hypothetical protein